MDYRPSLFSQEDWLSFFFLGGGEGGVHGPRQSQGV